MDPKFWLNVLWVVIGGELVVESLKYLFSGKLAFFSEGKPKLSGLLVTVVCLVLIAAGTWVLWFGLEPLLDALL